MKKPTKDQILKWGGLILVLIAVLLLYAGRADAGTATVCWTNPTQRTDGTAFPSSQIGSTKVDYGLCDTGGDGFGAQQGTGSATGAATCYTFSTIPAGAWCFRAFTVDTSGVSSLTSLVVSKTVPAVVSPPKPPTLTTITTVAYELQGTWWKRMVRVGYVPLGTACGEPWSGRGQYAGLSGDQVDITGRYKGGALFGKCA